MRLSKYAVATLTALALIPAAWSQSTIPTPLSGNQVTPRFSSEGEQNNRVTFNLGISSHFDDNALNNNQDKVSNFIYQAMPGLAWDISRPRWRFSADSITTVAYSYNLPQYGNFGENFIVSFAFNPTQRLNFRVRNYFNRTADPFNQFPSTNVPGFGTPDQPNPSIVGPAAERTSDQVGADATYQLGAHTNVGASGIFSLANYNALTATPASVQPDYYTTSGRAFVSHQFSPRNTSSLAYSIQRFTFSTGFGGITHSVSYVHSVAVTPTMHLSVWAGPEYLSTSTGVPAVPSHGSWSWSAGGSYDWNLSRTAITVGAIHQVSDGGGLGTLVRLTSADIGIRRRIGRHWSTGIFIDYVINDSIATIGGIGSNYLSGRVSISRTITPNFSLSVDYWRSRQWGSFVAGVVAPNDHNRAAVSLRYTFSRPIGS